MVKLEMKERLMLKTYSQLSAIYIRIAGKDLLRGKKRERVNTLYDLLKSKERWAAISNS